MSRKKKTWPWALFVVLLAAGCSDTPGVPFDEKVIRRDLSKRSRAAVFDEADTYSYSAPADGRLTADQIELFLNVRKLGARIERFALAEGGEKADTAESADGLEKMRLLFQALGRADSAAAADVRAALLLKVNPQEYVWIRNRLFEAARMAQDEKPYLDAFEAAQREYDAAAPGSPEKAGYLEARRRRQDALAKWRRSQPENVQANLRLLRTFEQKNGEMGKIL